MTADTGKKIFACLGMFIAILVWSYSFVWYNEAFNVYNPLTIVTLRIVIAVLFMGIIYAVRRPSIRFHKKDYKYLVLISLFEPCLYFVAESYALREMPATTVSLFQNVFPVFLPAIILLFKVEKINPVMIAGFIFSLAGVCLLSFSRLPVWNVTPKGMMYILLCAGSILFYPVFIKKLSAEYSIRYILFAQYLIGSLFMLPIWLLKMQQGEYLALLHFKQVLPVIKLSVFSSLIASLFYLNAIRRLGVLVTVLWINFIPMITFLIESFRLKLSLDAISVLSMIMILMGFLSMTESHQYKKR